VVLLFTSELGDEMNQYERQMFNKYTEYKETLDLREDLRHYVGKRLTLTGILSCSVINMFADNCICIHSVKRDGVDKLIANHIWVIVPYRWFSKIKTCDAGTPVKFNGEVKEYREGKYGLYDVSYLVPLGASETTA